METFYDTLQVKEDAPPEIIRAAYKALSSMFHPDKNPGDAAAASMMQRINNAYRILRDPDLRARYDESLKRMRAQAATPPPPPPVDDDEPPVAQPPRSEPKATEKRSPSIWWPIIVGAISVKLVGAAGAVLGFIIYFWLEPKKGWLLASLAAVIVGIGTAAALITYSAGGLPGQSAPTQATLPTTDPDGSPCTEVTEFLGVCTRESVAATPGRAARSSASVNYQPVLDAAATYWARESTGSAEVGPWLRYVPAGTRFCRSADGTILKLYRPEALIDKPPPGPQCSMTSVAAANQL